MPLVELKKPSERHAKAGSQLLRDLRSRVRGEVRFDSLSRGLYATDASNFRVPPTGVVVPRDVEDVISAVQVCRDHGVSLVSRGGGTGLAGQALNRGVVLDHSKYLRRVLDLDVEKSTARVEAGCVLDTLRERTQAHGLTFGPDPSTHNRCTLGGMIGNNACGVHAMLSEFYGPGPRTEDNVEALDVLTYDGLRMHVGATSDSHYAAVQARGGREAEIYTALRGLVERYGDAIRKGFPDIQRRVSGYNLPALLPENGFDLASALVGSEGTCVAVLGATLKLTTHFSHRALLVLGYDDVFAAGDDVPRIREYRPIGLEGIDRLLVDYMRTKHMHEGSMRLLPPGDGWLLVEFGGESREEASARAKACARDLEGSRGAPRIELIEDEAEQERLWVVRKSGLGATAFVPGERDTWPGWEDSAVPVDRVGRYLRDLQALYDKYGFSAALYGHFGQGCIHTRINFDLASREGVDTYRRFTREAAELCVSHGGSLSGEHGDGQQRGDLLPVMYGPEVMAGFREFKQIWDPAGQMNPGRLVDATPRDANLRLGERYAPWRPATHFAYPEDAGDFSHAALRCVGVGECRKQGDGTMCPSFMVTHEEAHTTRGRAHMLFEMVKGDVIKDGWDSREVLDSLELCLSCKACKSECPVSVDMSKYKAEFLSHHYAQKLRPRQAYAFGWIHRWARIGVPLSRLANFVTHAPGLGRVAKWAANMAPQREIPRFATQTFRDWFNAHPRPRRHELKVILWPDTFNNHFFPQTLKSVVRVLDDAGVDVELPPRLLCCGRPLYDYGMLELGRELFEEILDALAPEIMAGTQVVGAEPSCVAALRDELLNQFPRDERAQALARQTFTLAEYLSQLEGYKPPRLQRRAILQSHCQGAAIMGTRHEQNLLERMGLTLEPLTPGCCGMAGSFGFERGDKYRVSVAAGERVLLPAVRAAGDSTLIVADGFSCREQIAQGSQRRALHLAEVLELAAHAPRVAEEGRRPEAQQAQLRQRVGESPGVGAGPAALCLGIAGALGVLAIMARLL